MHDDRFADSHVHVTGIAQGLGRRITNGVLASAGVLIRDKNVDRADSTAAGLRETGGEAIVRAVNILDEASVSDDRRAAVDALGPVDGFVNNTGV